MGKSATPRALPETEAKAVARMLRVSPQKLNLVAQLIRGKKVAAARSPTLEFSRKAHRRDGGSASRAPSPTPRTTTISTSTILCQRGLRRQGASLEALPCSRPAAAAPAS